MAEVAEEHVEDVDDTALLDDKHDDDTPEGSEDDEDRSSQTPDPVAVLAQEMGWSPKEQWRGKPEDWKDPASFIRASRDINRRLSSDVRELRQTTERMGRTTAAIAERAIQEERGKLDSRFTDAVEAGDVEAAHQAREDLTRFDRSTQVERQPLPKPEATTAFEERNASWLGKNKAATALAVSECERLSQTGITDPEAQLEIAEREVKRRFPELFEDDKTAGQERQQRDQPRLGGSQSRSSGNSGGKKSAKDLPPDARKAAEDFLKRGRIGSLQEYAEIYFEEQA